MKQETKEALENLKEEATEAGYLLQQFFSELELTGKTDYEKVDDALSIIEDLSKLSNEYQKLDNDFIKYLEVTLK